MDFGGFVFLESEMTSRSSRQLETARSRLRAMHQTAQRRQWRLSRKLWLQLWHTWTTAKGKGGDGGRNQGNQVKQLTASGTMKRDPMKRLPCLLLLAALFLGTSVQASVLRETCVDASGWKKEPDRPHTPARMTTPAFARATSPSGGQSWPSRCMYDAPAASTMACTTVDLGAEPIAVQYDEIWIPAARSQWTPGFERPPPAPDSTVAPNRGANIGSLVDELGEGAAKVPHRNSLDYVGDTHVYRIKGPDGTTYRIGESARGVRASDGLSIRAEEQVRRLVRTKGPGFESEIRKTFPNKAAARDYERQLIERFRRMYGEETLPGNKSYH